MDPKIEAAWIAGAFSLVVALVSIVVSIFTQLRSAKDNSKRDQAMVDLQARTNQELTKLTAKLSVQRDEEAALRDYRYEALKRLYAEVNPILFRLRESCESSLWRVRRIVREDIDVGTDRHLLTSTQRLVAPLVIAQELQRNLTAVDLQLDPNLRDQYVVARELLWILHEGTTIAAAEPAIDYLPVGDVEKGHRQHLTFAQLQRMVDVATVPESDGSKRPIKLSELENGRANHEIAEVLHQMKKLFRAATSSSTPVLWRLLLAQASLMYIFIDLVDRGSANPTRVLPLKFEEFQWRSDGGPTFESQIGAVDSYVTEKLRRAGINVDVLLSPPT